MKKTFCISPQQNNSSLIAGIFSFALHIAVAGWMYLSPATHITPQQQLIQVAMVSPSSAHMEKSRQKVKETVKKPLQKKETLWPAVKQIKKEQAAEEKKNDKQNSVEKLTTGQQKKEAKASLSAFTEPQSDADYLDNAAPLYPEEARKNNVEGMVLLKVSVSAKGKVEKVIIKKSSGSSLLDYAAKEAVEKWNFVPAFSNGKPVSSDTTLPVIFKMENAADHKD